MLKNKILFITFIAICVFLLHTKIIFAQAVGDNSTVKAALDAQEKSPPKADQPQEKPSDQAQPATPSAPAAQAMPEAAPALRLSKPLTFRVINL